MLFDLNPSLTVSHLHPTYLKEGLPLLPPLPSQSFYLFHKKEKKSETSIGDVELCTFVSTIGKAYVSDTSTQCFLIIAQLARWTGQFFVVLGFPELGKMLAPLTPKI